jgi:hypothetical protein
MPAKGYTWTDEYRERFYASDAVQEHLTKFIALAKEKKPESTRIKMSLAKKDRKYSAQHKHNQSEAQKFRHALKRELQTSNPELSSDEIWAVVREHTEALK